MNGQPIPSPVTRLTKGYANQKTYGPNMVDLIDRINHDIIARCIYEPYADEILAKIAKAEGHAP